MTPAETITILRQFNEWRRCDEDIPQPDTREIGEAIDAAVEMIDRLEAAEKERDALRVDKATLQQMLYSIKNRLEAAEKSDAESLAMYRKARDERDALRAALQHEADCVEAAKAEIEALCAKVEAMEQQKPARLVTPTAYRWRYRGAVKWQYGELTEEVARLAKEHNHEVQALGILPGAQNVPTALLVAVADLIAQMEIVSRVGFVDTPDDKDSCAAFCVAEGSWLELMSAVESLASSILAAAPEVKP